MVPRRRPFLIKSLENTLSKLLKSLDFYDNAARHKVAIGMSHVPHQLVLTLVVHFTTARSHDDVLLLHTDSNELPRVHYTLFSDNNAVDKLKQLCL